MTKKYDVVSDRSLIELIKKVNASISNGWKLLGGITFGDDYFCQAMTKEFEDRPYEDDWARF